MSEAVDVTEQTFIDNRFGIVSNKRVVYFRAKGWFSGGSRQDVPLQHVTSVRIDTSRKIFGGIFLLFLGLGCLLIDNVWVKIYGIVSLLVAILLLWGSPTVVVNTAGTDLNSAKGWPWQRTEAEAFVEALRGQLFKS